MKNIEESVFMGQEEIIFPTNSKGEELAPYMLPLLEFYLNNKGSTDFSPEVLDTAANAFIAYLLRRSRFGDPDSEPGYSVQFLPLTEFTLWRKYDSLISEEPLSKYPTDSVGYENVLESLKSYVKKIVWPATKSHFPELPTIKPQQQWFSKPQYRYSGLLGGNFLGVLAAGSMGASIGVQPLIISIPISLAVALGFVITDPRNRKKDATYISTFSNTSEEVYTYILECKNILANFKENLPDDWKIVLTQNYRLVDSQ